MAARGTIAKAEVVAKLRQCFGADFAGESGGKYYVWCKENGEQVQIAIALTCPKTIVEFSATGATSVAAAGDEGFDFENMPTPQISEKERETVNELIRKLGL
jgi:hypothetical protein